MNLVQCTLAGNSGGAGVNIHSSGLVLVRSCIVWGNGATQLNPAVVADHSDVQGGFTGNGNINADPLFVNAALGDYTLQAGSPCIDVAHFSEPLDPDGTVADMGAFPYMQNVVGGMITVGTWTKAASPYVIAAAPCTVGVGQTLTIEPGVEVIWHGGYRIVVQGRIDASGTEADSIIFRPREGVTGGGFVFTNADTTTMRYVRVSGAYSSSYGGAMQLLSSGARLGLYNCVLDNNEASYGGGGIYSVAYNGGVTAENCRFSNNSSEGSGGGVVMSTGGRGRFTSCEFLDNTASDGAGLRMSDTSRVWLTDCVFRGNSAMYNGGALMHTGAYGLNAVGCEIDSNEAGNNGAGAYQSSGTMTFVECTFDTNRCGNDGGALYVIETGTTVVERSYLTRNFADQGPIAHVTSPTTLTLDRCTATGNDAARSGMISLYQATLNVTNSILWNQGTPPEIFDGSATSAIDVTYSDVWMDAGTYTGTGNVNVDPSFVDAAAGDYRLTGDLDGSNMSPCIDAGDPASPDLDGTAADMGAFTFIMFGDATADRRLTAEDAAELLKFVVGLVTDVNLYVGDVTDNGSLSSFDAALVLRKAILPGYLFPVEGGALPRTAGNQPRVLAWERDGDDWVLSVDHAEGIGGVTLALSVDADGELSAESSGLLATSLDGRRLEAAMVLPAGLTGSSELLRLRGELSAAPMLLRAELNEGAIPVGDVVQPFAFALDQNFPNPFNPITTIRYSLADAGRARLVIYNLAGQQVRTLVDADLPPGAYSVSWDGRDGQGRAVASGAYVYRLTSGQGRLIRRMIMVK